MTSRTSSTENEITIVKQTMGEILELIEKDKRIANYWYKILLTGMGSLYGDQGDEFYRMVEEFRKSSVVKLTKQLAQMDSSYQDL